MPWITWCDILQILLLITTLRVVMVDYSKQLFYLLLLFLISLSSCKKEKEVEIKCGCESESVRKLERIWGDVSVSDSLIYTQLGPPETGFYFESCNMPDSILSHQPNKDNNNEYFFWGEEKRHCLNDTILANFKIDSAQRITRGCDGTRINYIREMAGVLDRISVIKTDSFQIFICNYNDIPDEYISTEIFVSGYKKWNLTTPFPGGPFLIEVDSIWFKDPPE